MDLVFQLCMNQVQNLLDTQAECSIALICCCMLVPGRYNIHLMMVRQIFICNRNYVTIFIYQLLGSWLCCGG